MQLIKPQWISMWGPLAALILLLSTVAIPGVVGAELNGDRLRNSVSFAESELRFGSLNGFDTVELADGGHLLEAGYPMVPVRQVRIALPAGMQAERLELARAEYSPLGGEVDLYPAQPPQRIGREASPGSFVPPDPEVYSSDRVYPREPAVLVGHTDLAGQAMAIVELRPLRYLPAERRLELATQISFDLVLRAGYECGDYLPAAASISTQRLYAERLARQVINPGDAQPRTGGGETYLRSNLEPGYYEYVVIGPGGLGAAFEPLVEWKTRKGIPARIVSTSWIYDEGGYSGSDEEKIRAFIIDAHSEWGTVYVLLGGDTNIVPCHWRSSPIEPYTIPNDTFYADFDDDWTVEIAVGRAPVRYASYIYTFNQKIFTYEQSPPLTDYAQEIAMLGFDLDGSTYGEVCKEDIVAQNVPGDWDVTTVYDSESGAHKNDVLAALNAGPDLVNHIDHCDTNEMGVGSIHHDEYLWSSDWSGLTNDQEQCILYSLGCYANNYEENTCIAEHAVRYNTGGALAFAGNSRFGWYNPGTTQTLSFRYDRQFFDELFDVAAPVLGDVFAAHKNAFHPTDDTYRYIFTELTLLGDPQLEIWTEDPTAIAVAHVPQIVSGPGDLVVTVTAAGGGALSDVRVCVWKGDEVYERGWTGGDGTIVFDLNPQTAGPLLVTASGPNLVPYLGQVTVLDHSGAVTSGEPTATYRLLPSLRNPFHDQTELRFGLPEPARVSLRIYDVTGRQVRALVAGEALAAGVHAYPWDGCDDAGRTLSSGVYLGRFDAGPYQETQRLILSR